MRIPYSYLQKQFSDADEIWLKIRKVVERGDFTLGKELGEFEEAYAAKCQVKHAIGVNSGTDAIALPLQALGITGDVIVPAFSFFASAGAIVQANARPVFVDVGLDFNIDTGSLEGALTKSTEAIVPVHWGGRPCNMSAIMDTADVYGYAVIEDACQAVGSSWNRKSVGSYGQAGAFSLHPLKRVLSFGDGGVVTTNDSYLAGRLRKIRNHGMASRNEITEFGVNSRLDTVHAVVAHHILDKLDGIVSLVNKFAARLNEGLQGIEGIHLVPLAPEAFSNWYLFTFLAKNRDGLIEHLAQNSIEAKVHYPIPLHLQPAAQYLGYKRGAFPVAERCADETISLPIHQFLTMDDAETMIEAVRSFYQGK